MSKRKTCKTAGCGRPVEPGYSVCTPCLNASLREAAETVVAPKTGQPVSPFGTSFTREMKLGEQFDIQTLDVTVLKRADDYKVSVLGYPAVWECGKTVNEALGKLVQSHPDLFGKVERHSFVAPSTFLECGGCGYSEVECKCEPLKADKLVDAHTCPYCDSIDRNVRLEVLVPTGNQHRGPRTKVTLCPDEWHEQVVLGSDDLRKEVVKQWGPAGWHVQIFDEMAKRLRMAEADLADVVNHRNNLDKHLTETLDALRLILQKFD